MNNPQSTQIRVTHLLDNDNKGRAWRRARVKGLVDGNPPYNATTLRNSGRADACNVNWRQAESFLGEAQAAFYDVYSEPPTYATVELDIEDGTERKHKSDIVTQEFSRMLEEDEGFDNTMQVSQESTILYGRGPLMFPDEFDWRPENVQDRDLLVPDRALSNVSKWQEMCILQDLTPDQLYSYIRNEDEARQMGWNIQAVKQAIIHASTGNEEQQEGRSWEYYQEKLLTQSQYFNDDSMVIRMAHYYVREFPTDDNPDGGITHSIVLNPNDQKSDEKSSEFLFKKVNRYKSWRQVIHPMYYDNLGGGKHYAVKGLGQKMYSALEFINRLTCKIADDVFAPRTILTPTSQDIGEKLKMLKFGAYGVVPPGVEASTLNFAGSIDESLAFGREINNRLSANLQAYRSDTEQKSGNPITAQEANIRASNQAKLGATQVSRYYRQLGWLYHEMYVRAVSMPDKSFGGGMAARDFIERCKKRGVTVSELKNIRRVIATRIVGQGSQFMRQQALDYALAFMDRLPADGQHNLISDAIASRVGIRNTDRYLTESMFNQSPNQQHVMATLQVAAMKSGTSPVITPDQDHKIFALTFLKAAADSIRSAQAGGNPQEIFNFLDLAMPGAANHIQALAADKTQKDTVKMLEKQWKQVAALADQLRKHVGATPQQQQRGADMSFDQKLKLEEAKQKAELEKFKLQESNARSNAKTGQQLINKQRQADQEIAINAQKAAQEAATNNGGTDQD